MFSNKFVLLTLFIVSFFCSKTFAQSVNELEKQKKEAEKTIIYLNELINESAKNRSVSLRKLSLIKEKISQTNILLTSLNDEVFLLQKSIEMNQKKIDELNAEKDAMLNMYSKLVYETWKKRNKISQLMFIFSSSDFNQAYNRFKYFQQIQDYSNRQIELIERINDSLAIKNKQLDSLKYSKNTLLSTIQTKNKEYETEKLKENQYIATLKKKEKEWNKKLKQEEQNQQRLSREINRLISKQIKKSGSTSSTKYKLTPEEKLVSDNFEKNKGKLPWPVLQGFISKKFGLNTDPIYKKVKIFYDGVDIMTSKNADVRAVFKGIVSDIGYDPFMNNLIIIRHGSYLTVYANVIDITVKKGDKVDTKDIIGKVGYNPEEGSVLIFQLWKDIEKQNPEYWFAK